MQKHLWLLLLVVLSTAIESMAKAKEGDIKFGKHIIYEGRIENKRPFGKGTLKILNLKDNKKVDAEISGVFDNMVVSDPVVKIGEWFDSSFLGNCEIETIGELKNPTEVKFNLTKTKKDVKQLGITLEIPSLLINIKKNDKEWHFDFLRSLPSYMSYQVDKALSYISGGDFNYILQAEHPSEYPKILDSLGYSSITELWLGTISKNLDNGSAVVLTPLYFIKESPTNSSFDLFKPITFHKNAYYSKSIEAADYILLPGSRMLNINNLLVYKIHNNGKWTGFVALGNKIMYRPNESDTIRIWDVNQSTQEIQQMYASRGGDDKQMQSALDNHNLGYYVGTISDVDSVIRPRFKASSIRYENGQYHQGHKVRQWINGKSTVHYDLGTITEIQDFALKNESLEELIIPSSVRTISYDAFEGANIKKLIFMSSYPPEWRNKLAEFRGGIVEVPAGTINRYNAVKPYSNDYFPLIEKGNSTAYSLATHYTLNYKGPVHQYNSIITVNGPDNQIMVIPPGALSDNNVIKGWYEEMKWAKENLSLNDTIILCKRHPVFREYYGNGKIDLQNGSVIPHGKGKLTYHKDSFIGTWENGVLQSGSGQVYYFDQKVIVVISNVGKNLKVNLKYNGVRSSSNNSFTIPKSEDAIKQIIDTSSEFAHKAVDKDINSKVYHNKPRRVNCAMCRGTGRSNGPDREICVYCHGRGYSLEHYY